MKQTSTELETELAALLATGSETIELAWFQVNALLQASQERQRLDAIQQAAIKLIKCKGRFHTEQNMRALADLLEIPLPTLEPEAWRKDHGENAVRYCPDCGHIGEVEPQHRDCCPDGSHARMIRPDIAQQARYGFYARLGSQVPIGTVWECNSYQAFNSDESFMLALVSVQEPIAKGTELYLKPAKADRDEREAVLWKAIDAMFASADECVFDDQLAFCILTPEFNEGRESFEELAPSRVTLAAKPQAAEQSHCMCPACKDGTIHASDCAVHNAPALPVGECNCSKSQPIDERAAFEKWARPDAWQVRRNLDGEYSEPGMSAAWSAWQYLYPQLIQARAALKTASEQEPAGDFWIGRSGGFHHSFDGHLAPDGARLFKLYTAPVPAQDMLIRPASPEGALLLDAGEVHALAQRVRRLCRETGFSTSYDKDDDKFVAGAAASIIGLLLGYLSRNKTASEQEPVAWLHRLSKTTELSFFNETADCTSKSDWIGSIPLYAAPVPAQAVPDEMKANPIYPDEDKHEQEVYHGYVRGWNACRKAMLSAAPQPSITEGIIDRLSAAAAEQEQCHD